MSHGSLHSHLPRPVSRLIIDHNQLPIPAQRKKLIILRQQRRQALREIPLFIPRRNDHTQLRPLNIFHNHRPL